MKKILIAVLLLLVLGGIGFFIYDKNKDPKKVPSREYGILNPNPNDGSNNVREGKPSEDKAAPTEPVKTQEPRGRVLGEESPKPAKPVVTPTPTTLPARSAAPQPRTVTTVSTTNTYQVAGANLEMTVPKDWTLKFEEGSGNIIAFYNASGGSVGHIEVLIDVQQSFDSLSNEIRSNPNITGVQQITFKGQPALSFNDQRFGGGTVIALVYGNNVYYFRGSFANQTYYQQVRFIN